MRRNLTISFDADFIAKMDERRGAWSRGAYIEALCADQDLWAPHIPGIPCSCAVCKPPKGV
jgi:hypothetical protein